MEDDRLRRIRALVVGGTIVLLAAGAIGRWAWSRRGVDGAADMAAHLEDIGRVAVVGGSDLLRLRADGATLVPASGVPGLEQALAGTDEEALARVLSESGVAGVIADGRGAPGAPLPEGASLAERLASYQPFEQLQAAYLAPAAALYVPRTGLVVQPPNDFALAYVARGILGGARPPRVQSFPEPLRRIRNVEVMVMLVDAGRPRLWRSARGSSIARALLTASIVARQRWTEREAAMGGSLDSQLAAMDVEVYLLDEDGSLGSRAPAFLERVFTPEHGVAFDHLGTWRYLLPEATRERGEGSAVRAYGALFEDSDMEPDSLTREDVRLYRLLARLLARSPARTGSARSVAPPPSIDPTSLPAAGSLDELGLSPGARGAARSLGAGAGALGLP